MTKTKKIKRKERREGITMTIKTTRKGTMMMTISISKIVHHSKTNVTTKTMMTRKITSVLPTNVVVLTRHSRNPSQQQYVLHNNHLCWQFLATPNNHKPSVCHPSLVACNLSLVVWIVVYRVVTTRMLFTTFTTIMCTTTIATVNLTVPTTFTTIDTTTPWYHAHVCMMTTEGHIVQQNMWHVLQNFYRICFVHIFIFRIEIFLAVCLTIISDISIKPIMLFENNLT